jgi:hypothetical protein
MENITRLDNSRLLLARNECGNDSRNILTVNTLKATFKNIVLYDTNTLESIINT